MASDFVSRNPPALPSASVPWPRRAAWWRLWRDDTDASLLVSVSLRGAAGSASVKRRVRRSQQRRISCAIGFYLPIFKHKPLFLQQLLELEFTQLKFHFSKLSKLFQLPQRKKNTAVSRSNIPVSTKPVEFVGKAQTIGITETQKT